jgi:hypothetical protein
VTLSIDALMAAGTSQSRCDTFFLSSYEVLPVCYRSPELLPLIYLEQSCESKEKIEDKQLIHARFSISWRLFNTNVSNERRFALTFTSKHDWLKPCLAQVFAPPLAPTKYLVGRAFIFHSTLP